MVIVLLAFGGLLSPRRARRSGRSSTRSSRCRGASEDNDYSGGGV
jgi:hypothetical protein